jgi:hypothetical protein
MKRAALLASLVLLVLICVSSVSGEKQNLDNCFKTSLHHTTRGMDYWYSRHDGFSAITGIPYSELGCKNCHATSCNDCHLEKTSTGLQYSLQKAKKTETCLKCHAREKATLSIDKARNTLGVHQKASMVCADCHTKREMHGDGTCYESMRAPGAMDVKCTNCHTEDSKKYPAVPQTNSHFVHRDKLDCAACHVQNSMTCYNCHFGVLQKTKSKPQSMVGKAKDFLLLVKYNGKITSGTMQTLVGADNYPYISYVPYLTHSVTAKGRKCEACHANKAVRALSSDQDFVPATFNNGKLEFYKGVIPVLPQKLKWPFLEKKEGKWSTFEPETQPLIQMGVYASPLSAEEVKKMSMDFSYSE